MAKLDQNLRGHGKGGWGLQKEKRLGVALRICTKGEQCPVFHTTKVADGEVGLIKKGKCTNPIWPAKILRRVKNKNGAVHSYQGGGE